MVFTICSFTTGAVVLSNSRLDEAHFTTHHGGHLSRDLRTTRNARTYWGLALHDRFRASAATRVSTTAAVRTGKRIFDIGDSGIDFDVEDFGRHSEHRCRTKSNTQHHDCRYKHGLTFPFKSFP
jgi:hypothetical protein